MRGDCQSMSGDEGQARITWLDADVPFNAHYGDAYYARSDGFAEVMQVFLAGNGLPGRWLSHAHDAPFVIGELGFGTGLNFVATARAWQSQAAVHSGGQLRYVSFERHPLSADTMRRAMARWPDLSRLAEQLCDRWPRSPAAGSVIELSIDAAPAALAGPPVAPIALSVIIGDAQETLARWSGAAHAWYLDGFAPARNPQLWSPEILRSVAAHTAPGGTFSTYTAAGHVRRSLTAAGFRVCKVPGFGQKRERLEGTLLPEDTSPGVKA